MAKIFISYRRDDSAGHAGRLYDRLRDHFGPDQVFMDIDAIVAGRDFVDAVRRAVRGCDGLVAIIGREWLTISDASGSRRLDDPGDLVRQEIATALDLGIRGDSGSGSGRPNAGIGGLSGKHQGNGPAQRPGDQRPYLPLRCGAAD